MHDLFMGEKAMNRKEVLRKEIKYQIVLVSEGLAEEDQYLLETNLDAATYIWGGSDLLANGVTNGKEGPTDQRSESKWVISARGELSLGWHLSLSCGVRVLRAFNSPYYPGVILEGESRSLRWPLATTLFAIGYWRMNTPKEGLKHLGRKIKST